MKSPPRWAERLLRRQAHFGRVIFNTRTGTLSAIPLAVMNAVYLGQQQTLLGSDVAGHSSIWSDWPTR